MTRCGCAPAVAPGATEIANSACFSSAGAGTVTDPFLISPVIDPDVANLLSCGGAGMFAGNPDAVGWSTYTPVWDATGSAPAVGNGSLIGAYHKNGQTLDVAIGLRWGSTTTNGTGVWGWSLPPGLVCGFPSPINLHTYNSDTGADWAYATGLGIVAQGGSKVGAPVINNAPGACVVLAGPIGYGYGSYVYLSGSVYVTT